MLHSSPSSTCSCSSHSHFSPFAFQAGFSRRAQWRGPAEARPIGHLQTFRRSRPRQPGRPEPPPGRFPSATAGPGESLRPRRPLLPPINNPARRPDASRHYASPQSPAHRGPSPHRQRCRARETASPGNRRLVYLRTPLLPSAPLPSPADGAPGAASRPAPAAMRRAADAQMCKVSRLRPRPESPRPASPCPQPRGPRPSLPRQRRDGRQHRGALTSSSQGLSPALPGASAPAAQRLHMLSGRSSLFCSAPGYDALWSARSGGAPAGGQPGPSLGG